MAARVVQPVVTLGQRCMGVKYRAEIGTYEMSPRPIPKGEAGLSGLVLGLAIRDRLGYRARGI